MRGRRSSRGAAVVLAGCVGLAVMAPGLALAADPETPMTDEQCEVQLGSGPVFSALSGTCEAAPEATTTAPPSGDDTDVPPEADDDPAPPTTTTPEDETPGPTPSVPEGQPLPGATNTGNEDAEETVPDGTPASARTAPIDSSALAAGVPEVQAAVDDLLDPDGPPLTLLPLPNLPEIIPQPDADGNFENANDACLNAISGLEFPDGTTGLEELSTQLQGFCQQLDPTTLTDLLGSLIDLLNGLIPSMPTPGNPIPTDAPRFVPAEYRGYWHKQYDVDCPELTYEEANAIYAADPSDPFRLDGDGDGEACEENAHGDDVEFIGYPVGGVATGDGSTGSGASGVEVALAAGALSGLGVTGLALVRRFARQG